MCCLNFIGAIIFLGVMLVVQGIVFFGLTVISYGISLIIVLLLQIHNTNSSEVNTAVWVIFALIILSYLSQGIFLGFERTFIKHWLNGKKNQHPFLFSKFPIYIYSVLLFVSLAALFRSYPMQAPEIRNDSNHRGIQREGFTIMFLVCISFLVYMSAGFSDWVAYLNRPELVRQQRVSIIYYILDGLVCVLTEILNTFINPILLLILIGPLLLEQLGFSLFGIIISAVAAVFLASYFKADKLCPRIPNCKSSYTEENLLFVRNCLLSFLWFPIMVGWYLKGKAWKAGQLNLELNDRTDFVVWVALLSIVVFKALRNVTVTKDGSARVTEEPVGGGDNSRRKIPPLPEQPPAPQANPPDSQPSVFQNPDLNMNPTPINPAFADPFSNISFPEVFQQYVEEIPQPSAPHFQDIGGIGIHGKKQCQRPLSKFTIAGVGGYYEHTRED